MALAAETVGEGGPVEERVSAADRAHSDHHRGLIMPASLLELMPAFLLSLLVTVAGGLTAYNIRCQYPGSW